MVDCALMTQPVRIRGGSSIIPHGLPENTLTADNNRSETRWGRDFFGGIWLWRHNPNFLCMCFR